MLNNRKTALSGVLVFSVFLAAAAVPESAFPQEDSAGTASEQVRDTGPSFALLLDPGGILFSLIFGIAAIEPDIQIALIDYLALDIKPAFAYYFGDWIDADIMGGGGSLGLRIIPFGTRLRGFYIVPRCGTLYLQGESTNVSLETMIVTPSVEIGYSWIWGAFIMNLGGGAGYNITVAGDDIYEDDVLRGFQLLFNFSIGFAV